MTDLATDLEAAFQQATAAAEQPSTFPDVVIDLAASRPVRKAHTVFHAWKEDTDTWDGWAMYTDLQTALQTAASDYVSGEYGDQDDPETARPNLLVWSSRNGTEWHLTDGGHGTDITVTATTVYAAVLVEPASA
jgi:hypothetical protein